MTSVFGSQRNYNAGLADGLEISATHVVNNGTQQPSCYEAKISDFAQFEKVTELLSTGMSYQDIASLRNRLQSSDGLSKIGRLIMAALEDHAPLVTTLNLERIRSLMARDGILAFSLTFDTSTIQGKSFVDVRLYIPAAGQLHNIHVFSLPLRRCFTVADQLKLLEEKTDALYQDWRTKLIDVSTDCAPIMTDQTMGVVAQLALESNTSPFHEWCARHKLDPSDQQP
ncbi:hypothetical protein GGI17_005389 [Coemansia sp. S146]|nr:hypothetical protein GGI17_005389 [Coemansia sp. S146]